MDLLNRVLEVELLQDLSITCGLDCECNYLRFLIEKYSVIMMTNLMNITTLVVRAYILSYDLSHAQYKN